MNPVRKVFDILENLPDGKIDPNEAERELAVPMSPLAFQTPTWENRFNLILLLPMTWKKS
jgi:hypothetical protein